jgi:hypothetical protein
LKPFSDGQIYKRQTLGGRICQPDPDEALTWAVAIIIAALNVYRW